MLKKFLISFIYCFIIPFKVQAHIPFKDVDKSLNKDPYLASGYQQQEYQLKDIQGDYSLLIFARSNMQRIKLMLKKDDAAIKKLIKDQENGYVRYKEQYKQWDFNQLDPSPQSTVLTLEIIESLDISAESKKLLKDKYLNKSLAFELKSKPFSPKRVAEMMTQVIYEEYYRNGITPKQGQEHRFSEEILTYYKKEFPILKTGMTKLFMALGNGLTFRFMITGQERALSELIEAQDYNSVTMEQVFRWSYRLNKGDVYLTLLTIENLFAYHWTNPQREKMRVVQRLSQISHYFYNGDKFGHWYHYWGMVLYGYLRGSIQAGTVGIIENTLSEHASKVKEPQEGRVNFYGALVGGKLRKVIKYKKYLKEKFDPNPQYLESTYYLRPMNLDETIKKQIAD